MMNLFRLVLLSSSLVFGSEGIALKARVADDVVKPDTPSDVDGGFEKDHNPVYKDYSDYVESQDKKTSNMIKTQGGVSFIPELEVKVLAQYLSEKVPMKHHFALTHGSRSGYEQKWFKTFLPGVEVIGTELSPSAKDIPNTIQWDFHDVKPEWEGKVDFVYSNALDHSYNPSYAVKQWMREVAPEGVLVIEHSIYHEKSHINLNSKWHGKVDVYGDTLDGFKDLIVNAGDFEIADVVSSPDYQKKSRKWIIVRHKKP